MASQFGEPLRPERGLIVGVDGKPVAFTEKFQSRLCKCFNALAGIADPAETITNALDALKSAKAELRLLHMKDTDTVYDPTVWTKIDLAIESLKPGV